MKALAQEVVAKFGERLKPLGLVVKEYTGDTQLTKQEVEEANLIVTTPEKVILLSCDMNCFIIFKLWYSGMLSLVKVEMDRWGLLCL